MIKKAKISVITASYNYENLISIAIESVINQTYKNWELIIVDDGSKDNSIEVIKNYAEKYENIKLFQHEKGINKGLKETVKLGIENSSGDYIAFLEADDYWAENAIEKRVEIINKGIQSGLIFNAIELFGDKEAIDCFDKYFKEQKNLLGNISFPCDVSLYLSITNVIPTLSCVMIKKDLIEKCNFETPYDPWLDWWIYAQLSAMTKFDYIDEKLTFWRRHNESYSSPCQNLKNKERQLYFKNHLIKHLKGNDNNLFSALILNLANNNKIGKLLSPFIKKVLINKLSA